MSGPTTLRAVVIDDEAPARDRLRRLLRDHPDVVCVGEAGDVDAAVALIDRERPELCFLDVQIPGGDGFDVLARVRHQPAVVFTTAYDQYAVRAFEVHSIDYLLKPFRAERFAAALDRAREAAARKAPDRDTLERAAAEVRQGVGAPAEAPPAGAAAAPDGPERIPARRGARIALLDPADVLWFEADETLVFARTAEGRFLVDRTLVELETRLGGAFFRAHRQYLVRLDRIVEIRPQEGGTYRLSLRNTEGISLPLSRRQARRLKERLAW